jgi:CDP-diacylglycerol--glycerol-3-phosphate 3-phosphatidyltransferase
VARAPLTFRRLTGLDRSGGSPPETQKGAPLRPWTIPNAIGYVRLALIPIFCGLVFSDDDGKNTWGAIVFAVIAWSDYLDGIAARVTGQFSRMGALMDPVIDRLLVLSGIIACWHFDLLPKWALAALAARELVIFVLAQMALHRGLELKINWWGRWGVWPAMSAPFFAIADAEEVGELFLYLGLILTWTATVLYILDARRQVSANPLPER